MKRLRTVDILAQNPELLAEVEARLGGERAQRPGNPEEPNGEFGAASNVEAAPALHQAVRSVILDKRVSTFDKRRDVARLIEQELSQRGHFFRTADSRLFFFEGGERRIYDLDQRPFQHQLTCASGLSATEGFHRFTLDVLQARTSQNGPVADVHTLAHFDPATGFLAVSDGGSGIWWRERQGNWKYASNGDAGLYFIAEAEATPWVPEFPAGPEQLDWLLNVLLFGEATLSRLEQRQLFQVWLLQQFFPRLCRTRTIPACLGPHGSGKTTAERLVGRLLVGPAFDVTGVHRDREDAFVAAVTNRVVYGLDNADSRIAWLEDALARYATGERYRMRQLYTTNEEISYTPRAILMLSSRDPQFNRPDVAERLLPLYFHRPETYRTEEEIFAELDTRRGAVMGALLTELASVADALEETPAPRLTFRMADFAAFGWRVSARRNLADEWQRILTRLEKAQAEFASDGDGVIAALATLLERDGPIVDFSVGDLFRKCREIAQDGNLLFPRTAQGFGRRLSTLRRVIELELAVKLQESRSHQGGARFLTITPRGQEGGEGVESGSVG